MVKRWLWFFAIAASWQILPENGHSQPTHDAGVNAQDANEAGNNKPFSIPVRILEAPLPQPDHEQDREQRRRQEAREEENLATQKSIAVVSEKLSHYTLYQLWLSILSAFGLTMTVIFAGLAWKESKTATSTAKEALKDTQNTSKKQLRAYMSIVETLIPPDTPEGRFYVRTVLKNCGQTPATITHTGYKCFLASDLEGDLFEGVELKSYSSSVGPGQDLTLHMGNSNQAIENLREMVAEGLYKAGMRIEIHYTDIFGEKHLSKFTRVIEGRRELNADFSISLKYPDEVT